MVNRRSDNFVIEGSDGEFDNFFTQLEEALESGAPQVPAATRKNPFKYLGSHEVEDAPSLLERENETQELLGKVDQRATPVLCVIGPAKSGKTSLVRAGLMAGLHEVSDLPIYVRCRGSLEQSLITELRKYQPNQKTGETWASMLIKLAAGTNQHVVLILDQFERVLMQHPRSAIGREGLKRLRQLAETTSPNLTIVCVSTDEGSLALALLQSKKLIAAEIDTMTVPEMEPSQVAALIQKLAASANIEMAPQILEGICQEYESGLESELHFSLSHVQTICHVLCEKSPTDIELYRRLMRDERPTLDLALNRCDIVNFIEDVPNIEERCLLRDLIRLVSHPECNEKIVNYVRDHVSGMWPPAAWAARSGRP
jgi:hypothetical protein